MTLRDYLEKVDPLLARLREERFTAGHDELQKMVERLFEPLEYLNRHGVGEVRVDLSPFSVAWAWDRYWGATTQEAIDTLVICWAPTIIVSKLKVPSQ